MKRTLSRFFPPSSRFFQKEMDSLKASSAEQKRLQTDLAAQLDALAQAQAQFRAFVQEYQAQEKDSDAAQRQLLNKTAERLDTVSEMLSGRQRTHQELQAKTDSVIGGISGLYQKEFPIDVRFEREYYKDFPVCTSSKAPDFQTDFLPLVDGLDKESVETVVLALQRLKLIQNSEEPAMVLYSAEEKQTMRQLAEHFFSNIVELSESCYFYRNYLLPINHFEACVFWDRCGIPFLEHPERLADRDIVDAGAFIGDSALILSPLTKRKVYAFEPVPSNYALMQKTIKMNDLSNVVPCNFALGTENGVVRLSPSISSNGSCSTQFVSEAFEYTESVELNVLSLDEFVKEHDLEVGLIKADVEGAEQLLLQGAMETIKSQKPALLISIYHNASDFFKIKPMLEALDLGYRFRIRHPVGGSVMTEMLLIAEVP